MNFFLEREVIQRIMCQELLAGISFEPKSNITGFILNSWELMKKRVIIIGMGGTISSVFHESGFTPNHTSQDLVSLLPETQGAYEIETREVMMTDSSNLQPKDWKTLSNAIYEELSRNDVDGVVITHGTDTMAYTAAATSFMIQRHGKPVVFTGSQIPFTIPGSDGRKNLFDAIRVAGNAELAENVIVFDSRIFRSVRTVKLREYDLNAFESVDPSVIGEIALNIHYNDPTKRGRSKSMPTLSDKINPNVALIRVFPGMKPEFLDYTIKSGYEGIILDSFGAGNVPIKENSLLPKIKEITDRGVPIVITSQCIFGRTEMLYETGRLANQAGAIEGHDCVAEVALVKLMWILGQGITGIDNIKEMFNRNYVGEINLPKGKE